MSDQTVIKVVEIDPDRLRKLEQDVADMRTEGAVKKAEMGTLQKTMDRVVDVIFGNGKPGLKQQVPEVATKVDSIQTVVADIQRTVNGLNEKGVFSTQKMKAITREVIDNEALKPGTWQTFVKTWGVPIVLIILSSLIGGYIGHSVFP